MNKKEREIEFISLLKKINKVFKIAKPIEYLFTKDSFSINKIEQITDDVNYIYACKIKVIKQIKCISTGLIYLKKIQENQSTNHLKN